MMLIATCVAVTSDVKELLLSQDEIRDRLTKAQGYLHLLAGFLSHVPDDVATSTRTRYDRVATRGLDSLH